MRKFIFSVILTITCGSALISCSSDEQSAAGNAINHEQAKEPVNCYTDPLKYNSLEIKRSTKGKGSSGQVSNGRIHINNVGGPLAEVFNDSNKYQYAWAEKLGIEPIHTLADAFRTRRPLRKVQSCEAYYLEELTHSFPYLVPEAEDLLRQIGYNFIDSLAARGADGYRIKVTSLLRSPATVKKLRKINKNAVDSSTHQFGTTFDISWNNFASYNPSHSVSEEDLKNLLAEVLLDLRNQKRCLVKYEKKSPCFHITVTKP